jgi:putative transposase
MSLKVIGNDDRQKNVGRTIGQGIITCCSDDENQRCCNFEKMRILQKFVTVHAAIHNYFTQECRLYSGDNFKLNRIAALAEWRHLGAA